MDLSLSLLLILFTWPVMILSCLLIKVESRGKIFFTQERVGRQGKIFKVVKFRSMREDAEAEGPKWAVENDTRVTRYGRFMRKTRIDELPHVWNILKGEMSFVGPRPERPVFVEQLEEDIPFYNLRHCVLPGLTGWAQVMHPYGASVEDALYKLEYDLYYLKYQNFIFDLMVFFKTMKVVLSRKGV